MIQRIQTIYLLVATALSSSMLFTDLISFIAGAKEYAFNINGIVETSGDAKEVIVQFIAVTILLILTPLISLGTMLLYKKRIIQIRLCAINMGLLIGLGGLLYYVSHIGGNKLEAISSFNIPSIFPIISLVLTFMALKSIGKDEALIRSMDRIR